MPFSDRQYSLPKTVDRRIPRFFSPEASKYVSGHAIDLYSLDVYDFQRGMPGKGILVNPTYQPVTIDKVTYRSVEHYWQCMSCCDNPKLAENIFFADKFPSVNTLAQGKRHPNWDNVKKDVMSIGLQAKIRQHPQVLLELLATGNKYIANTDSNDNVFGTGRDGHGENMLGELYMDERHRLLASILQHRPRNPIPNPTAQDIERLAQFFEDDHPGRIEQKLNILMGKTWSKDGVSELVNCAYRKSLNLFANKKYDFDPAPAIKRIKSSEHYQDHQCNTEVESLLRPDVNNKGYKDIIYDKYHQILENQSRDKVTYYNDVDQHYSVNPLKKVAKFWTDGAGPLPGHITIALIGTILCVGLLASGVGAVAVPFVAAAFSMISGGMQGWKSASQNNLSLAKTVAATITGALTGLLFPWPFAGPLMTAVTVKAGEEACKLTKSFYEKVKVPEKVKDNASGVSVGAMSQVKKEHNMSAAQAQSTKLQDENKFLSPNATPRRTTNVVRRK